MVVEVKETQEEDLESVKTMKSVPKFSFEENNSIPNLESDQKSRVGFQNWAPLQADEQAKDLLRNILSAFYQ
jgi:hypothetical protein